MKKIARFIKRTAVGIVGGGGVAGISLAASVDVNTAILMGLTALVLIISGPEAAGFFKKLFADSESKSK